MSAKLKLIRRSMTERRYNGLAATVFGVKLTRFKRVPTKCTILPSRKPQLQKRIRGVRDTRW